MVSHEFRTPLEVILPCRLRRDGYHVQTNAVHDTLHGIRLVRAHANDWNLDPNNEYFAARESNARRSSADPHPEVD